MENPFEPNIRFTLLPDEEQFVFGEGGVNSGLHNISEYHPQIEGEARIQRHNVNSQRTYRNRYRDNYNKNMRDLYQRKYGKDAPDSKAKKRRDAKMQLINQNYRYRKAINDGFSKRAIKNELAELLKEGINEGEVFEGVKLADVFKQSGAPKKEISKIYKDKGLTFQQFKNELRNKYFESKKNDAIKNLTEDTQNKIDIINAEYEKTYGTTLTPTEEGKVYEKELVGKKKIGKRKKYEYAQVDYDGLQLHNKKLSEQLYGQYRFKPRQSAPTNLLVLKDYYDSVITTKKTPVLENHRKIEGEDTIVDTTYQTKYEDKRKEHRKALGAKEWQPSTNTTVFTPTI